MNPYPGKKPEPYLLEGKALSGGLSGVRELC